MSIIRQDSATKDWTIFAIERAKRPRDFKKKDNISNKKESTSSCPFCRGNEKMTPDPILVIPEKDSWEVRVVPNKFPAVRQSSGKDFNADRRILGPYLYMDGLGSHEVIVESPRHDDAIPLMKLNHVENIIKAYRSRYIELSKIEDYEIVIIFKNHGAIAGSSIDHPHSQLVALPFVPGYVRNKLYEALRYYDNFGSCVYCDMIHYETKSKERVIIENDHYIAFAPYASIVPYNVMIIPKKHMSCFLELPEEETRYLADILTTILKKIRTLLNDPDYNFVIDSSPPDKTKERQYHWHLEILPRLTTRAGFEIGSGVYINTILPEDCAKALREII